MGSEIEERKIVGHSIVVDLIADLVVKVVHQPAFLDGQDLVESTRNMEADGRHILE